MLSSGIPVRAIRALLVTFACATCLLAACNASESQAGTIEVTSQIGNYPSQAISQDSSNSQAAFGNMPAELPASDVAEYPETVQDPPSPVTEDQVSPPSSMSIGRIESGGAAEPSTTPDLPTPTQPARPVIEPGAAQAVENLASPQDRVLASQALGLIEYDWQNSLKGWELRFLGSRTGYRGMTYPDGRRIEVYLRAGDTPTSLAHVVAHELGHAVDLTFFDDGDRRAWMSARKVASGVPWFVGPGGADFSSGCGDFAESFAWWQVGPPDWFGELGSPPTTAQLGILVGLVVLPGLPR